MLTADDRLLKIKPVVRDRWRARAAGSGRWNVEGERNRARASSPGCCPGPTRQRSADTYFLEFRAAAADTNVLLYYGTYTVVFTRRRVLTRRCSPSHRTPPVYDLSQRFNSFVRTLRPPIRHAFLWQRSYLVDKTKIIHVFHVTQNCVFVKQNISDGFYEYFRFSYISTTRVVLAAQNDRFWKINKMTFPKKVLHV